MHIGTGTVNNANTAFYVDSSGNFSLKDKLYWNGTTLAINGGGTFSGALSAATGTFNGSIAAASGTFTGGVSGTGYTLNNSGLALTNASSSISLGNSVTVTSSGLTGPNFLLNSSGLVATSVTLTGAITATSGTIGGWDVASTTLSSGNITLDDANNRIVISD